MAESLKNIAVSVHQRLLNKAAESSRPFDNGLDVIVAAIKDACKTNVEVDGMFFDAETVTAVERL